MSKHLIPVISVLLALALPSSVGADGGDVARLSAFAAKARAAGTLTLTATYRSDADTCASHDTCGVAGTARARLRVDPSRPVRVAGKVIVLPVKGAVAAKVRDTVAGHVCDASAKVRTAGLLMDGDSHGVLLRVGVAPRGSGVDEPFDTSCRAPALAGLGAAVSPSVRVKQVSRGIDSLAVKLSARRSIAGQGYRGNVSTTARVLLRTPKRG